MRISLLLAVAFVSFGNAESVRLSGHVPEKVVSKAAHLHRLEASREVPLTFVLPLRNQSALEELVRRIHDPADQHYGQYLTPEQFAERFGPTQEDYDHLIAYAKSHGLTVNGTHSNRILLNVSGPSASIESAFNLELHQYQKANGRMFHAPNQEPEVPVSVAAKIHGIVGLDNHAVRRTYHQHKAIEHATANAFPSGPGGGFSPNDLLTAYNLNGVSSNGANQSIALFELSGYHASDINQYTSHFNLPTANLTNVLVDGGSGGGIDAEVTLDIELALALAPGSHIYVYEGPNTDQGVLDTYNRIATDNIAKQVSTSWGLGETFSSSSFLQAENAIFLQMATNGQTIYAAAGDSGAYDEYPYNNTLVTDDPASQPYVVSVGGTRLLVNGSNGAYSSESVWDNGLGNGAGGGGVSHYWSIPSWQQNVTTVSSKTKRNVPDVALNADPASGYAIYHNGAWAIYGGTSCAAPLWAAFTARVNQARIANMQSTLGFANPILYSIGVGSSYAQNFHDVTSGNNLYYSAGAGYDNASGWGSFNGANLFASLTNGFSPSPPPPPPAPAPAPVLALSMTSGGSFVRGGVVKYTIMVKNNGNGPTSGPVTVTFALSPGLTYQVMSGSGWNCNGKTLTCTRNDALAAGASYSPINLTVKVTRNNNIHQLTTTATVSGGGSASNTITSQKSL